MHDDRGFASEQVAVQDAAAVVDGLGVDPSRRLASEETAGRLPDGIAGPEQSGEDQQHIGARPYPTESSRDHVLLLQR